MSRYKDHRGPKRRGYDEDYTPDYHTAERQPEYFSPRPTFLNAVAPHTMAPEWDALTARLFDRMAAMTETVNDAAPCPSSEILRQEAS